MSRRHWIWLFSLMFAVVFVAGLIVLKSIGWALVVVAIYFFTGGVFLIVGDLFGRTRP